eukprot:6486472-Amphidinium_carterae.1
MLSLPKQTSHKRDLPNTFEGNKANEQQGATTTFKNWAAEVQIYMSLEDHNMADIMDDTKHRTTAIMDDHYIDYMLRAQGLGQEDEDYIRDKEVEIMTREHARDVTAPILRRNTELALRRRSEGKDGVPADEAVPQVPDLPQDYDPFTDVQRKHVNEYKDAFHHYSRVLQYVLTKVTKGEVYRLVVQCNHNNSSGFETWRRLHFTYDQGEKAQHLAQLARIMKPTWNNVNQQPNEFIKTFQHWRDEIYNYEQSVAELPSEMKMTLLIQTIQGDIRSHMLMNYNLTTANFDESCTRVEDYYRNVYVDNSAGQVAGVQNPRKKPWPPWKRQPWKNGHGKGKYDYDKAKGGKDKGGKDNPWKGGYDKGRKGKGRGYGKPWSKGKGKGDKGYNNYNYGYGKPKGYDYRKGKDKGDGGKPKGPPLPSNYGNDWKGKKAGKGKGDKYIVCYYCGKPGYTSDKCWWKNKGQIYNMDQPASMWSLPNDNPAQNLQPLSQSASTTLLPQVQPQNPLYEQQYTVRAVTGTTLVVDRDNTTTDQLRRWAILIDAGASTSVASREHFSHIPIKQLRHRDPQALTAVTGDNIEIYGIKEVTLVHDNLAIPTTFIICDVTCAILGLDTITKNRLQLN